VPPDITTLIVALVSAETIVIAALEVRIDTLTKISTVLVKHCLNGTSVTCNAFAALLQIRPLRVSGTRRAGVYPEHMAAKTRLVLSIPRIVRT